eukprot:m.253687 g.253687  ORF g.253687 m.253687 type:complete len:368 (+) comp18511_c0_seq1:228-1331(+)
MSSAPEQKMPMTVLGRSGLVVSRLSFGSWVSFANQVDVDAPIKEGGSGAYDLMVAAFKAGINFFDNAETYADGQSELIMGKCIKRGIEQGVWRRSDLVVSTKIFFGTTKGPNNIGLSRKHIWEGTWASLNRLGLEYVDILLCHRADPVTPIEETVRAMNAMIERGWAMYWGTSMWSVAQIEEAMAICDRLGLVKPICEQPEYNMFARTKVELEYAPLFKHYGLGITAWSPLASGVLTGKYKGGKIPEGSRLSVESVGFLKDAKLGEDRYQIDKTELLRPLASRLGCSLAQLAIAWTIMNPHCSTTILGATKVEQLQENLKALEVLPKMTPEIMKEIDRLLESKPSPQVVEQQVCAFRQPEMIHGICN